MVASYIWNPAHGQEEQAWPIWRSTEVQVVAPEGHAPTEGDFEEWEMLLPERPAIRGLFLGITEEGRERRELKKKRANEDVGRRNAASLELRLHQAGWLEAEVSPRWERDARKAKLILDADVGQRWSIDGISWSLQKSGLPERGVQLASQLATGMPLEMARLTEAQDNIAKWAKQHGFATFHAGLVEFELDTIGRFESHQANLIVTCAPWNPANVPWMDAVGDSSLLGNRPHPKVQQGLVRWNGSLSTDMSEGSRPGTLRAEVWQHAVNVRPGQEFRPQKVAQAYKGLSSLRMFSRVNVVQSLRWDTTATEREVGLPGAVVMDVEFFTEPKASHDLAMEVDFIRNDARYGPQLGVTMLHRNARGWGGENVLFAGFGYVAVAPFATFTSQNLLNSGEWSLNWKRSRIGIPPIPLDRLKTSTSPLSSIELGWDREIWPEFTRSQFHATHEFSFVENPVRLSKFRVSLVDVSFVNLTNRDQAFLDWLETQQNPLIVARFNNHATLGSSAAWESQWSLGNWKGRFEVQTNWAGGMAQALASWRGIESGLQFDESSGAWLVAEGVPIVQYGRGLLTFQGRRPLSSSIFESAFNVRFGVAQSGKNTPSLPLEQSFFTGGANGIRGWTIRTLGPGNFNPEDNQDAIQGVGDLRLDVQHELRLDLGGAWQWAWFLDAGNVWLHGDNAPIGTSWSDEQFSGLAFGSGVGIRYDLDFFLIRVDGGLRLHDPTQSEGSRWLGQGPLKGALHLGLGLPF